MSWFSGGGWFLHHGRCWYLQRSYEKLIELRCSSLFVLLHVKAKFKVYIKFSMASVSDVPCSSYKLSTYVVKSSYSF